MVDLGGGQCYYRAGKDRKGFYEPCIDVVKRDESRAAFAERVRTDEAFHAKISFKHPIPDVEGYLAKMALRGTLEGGCLVPEINKKTGKKDPKYTMCSAMYLMGELVMKKDKTSIVKVDNGTG